MTLNFRKEDLMRKASIAFLSAFALCGALSASAVAAAQSEATHSKLVPGYQDEHGIFHPFEHEEPDVTAAPTTGVITVTFHITVKTSLPVGTKVYCAVTLVATSVNASALTDVSYYETGAGIANSTNTTCTVPIHYSWNFPLPNTVGAKSTLAGSYTVLAVDTQFPTVGSSTVAAVRSESSTIPGLTAVPTTPTTPLSVNVTL